MQKTLLIFCIAVWKQCVIFVPKINNMAINKLKVVLTEEAQAFLDAQPFKAQQKIYYIFKVEEGVMKVDIFKKLENTA